MISSSLEVKCYPRPVVNDPDTRKLTIGEVAERTGVAVSALRFYDAAGFISSTRSEGGQRRFAREVLRRIAFIRAAQTIGLTLEEIQRSLATLPLGRTPTKADWTKLSRAWRPRIDEQIQQLERLRDQLTSCIGCGCLSLQACSLYNPDDRAATLGEGARYLLGNTPADLA
jgi:MerR family redox-sensitive transcriptional activator SoxR